jgi:hypothetical protein
MIFSWKPDFNGPVNAKDFKKKPRGWSFPHRAQTSATDVGKVARKCYIGAGESHTYGVAESIVKKCGDLGRTTVSRKCHAATTVSVSACRLELSKRYEH